MGVFKGAVVIAVPVCAAVWRDTVQEGAEDPAPCFHNDSQFFYGFDLLLSNLNIFLGVLTSKRSWFEGF